MLRCTKNSMSEQKSSSLVLLQTSPGNKKPSKHLEQNDCLSYEEGGHVSPWVHRWGNYGSGFKTVNDWDKRNERTNKKCHKTTLHCFLNFTWRQSQEELSVGSREMNYCQFCHLHSQKFNQIYFPEVAVLQQTQK